MDLKLFGGKIQRLRKEKNLSLVELSKLSGIQVATLSRIENGKMLGRVESHIAIANSLGVDFPELYSGLDTFYSSPVKNASENDDAVVLNRASSALLLIDNPKFIKLFPVIYSVKTSGKTRPEKYAEGSEMFVYVLEGEVNAMINNKLYFIKQDDSLYAKASYQHYFENLGSDEAKILYVRTQ